MATTALSSAPEEIREELRNVLRAGLPLTEKSAGIVLTEQRVVIAHAQHPHERASRISALDRVLRDRLNGIGRSARGQAARTLFGVARGTRGTTLTYRRLEAALILERHEDHVRKHIEPKLLDELAFALHQENLRYTPASRAGRPEIAAHDDTPVLTDDSFTEREEITCLIWSAVYGYKAELIAIQRLVEEADRDENSHSSELQDRVDTGTWQLARLLSLVSKYLGQYGHLILHGGSEFDAEGILALAGWRGGLRDNEARRLRYCYEQAGEHDRSAFLKYFTGANT